MSMITASTWVPRGCAASFPTKYDVDDKELARISKLAKLQLEDAKSDLDGVKNKQGNPTAQDSSDENDTGVELPRSQGYAVRSTPTLSNINSSNRCT